MAASTEHGWQQLSRLLDQALDLYGSEREAWLEALAHTRPEVAAELRELLAVHASNCAAGFLEHSPLDPAESLVGEQIGPYTVERLLGRGGMGSVWLGRRNDEKFDGLVAIKLLDRRGFGPQAADRVRLEATLLARLSHANIARLYDAGCRPNGRPYLILEYVEGEQLDHFCRTRQLSLAARLRLFLDVLQAVAHAHAQLVVHRDIKPSNVLVTADGTVKLLDFGVATLERPVAAESTRGGRIAAVDQHSPLTTVALTPGYASPEQLRGEPVSTAADVYALGVLLHVLVVGRHPFGAAGSTRTTLIRSTLTEDPPLASTRLGTRIERRRVRGDLDAIIGHALERDPRARYATAMELALDLRRYLENFPIEARHAGRAYAVRKFAQRHRGGVVGALLTLLVLISATVITTREMIEARRQRDFARTQLAHADAVNELNNYVLIDAAPIGKPFTVNELLGRAAHLLERQQGVDSNRVALLTSIGREYATQDEDQQALKYLEEAYRLSQRMTDLSTRARAACTLGNALAVAKDSPRPEALLAESLRMLPAGAEFALDRAYCQSRGSEIARMRGDMPLSVERAQQALQTLDTVPFEHELATLRTEADLAESYREAGRNHDAAAMFQRLWPRLTALGRDDTITAGTWLNNWGLVLIILGRPLEAERLLHRSVEMHRDGETDAAVSPMLLTNYSQALFDLARWPQAQDYAERALQAARRAGDEVVINQTLLRLARIYRAQHDYPRALAALDEVEPRLHEALPAGHYAFFVPAAERALLAAAQGDTVNALGLINQALALLRFSVDQHHSGAQYVPLLLRQRGSIEIASGEAVAAEADARQAITLLESDIEPGDHSFHLGDAYLTLARALAAEGHAESARGAARQAVEQLLGTVGPEHPDTNAARQLSAVGDSAAESSVHPQFSAVAYRGI